MITPIRLGIAVKSRLPICRSIACPKWKTRLRVSRSRLSL
jgi:hypothetical protein